MNTPKLYIHIGTHKTGSSNLQRILSDEQKKLIKEDVIYLGKYKDFAKHLAYSDPIDQKLVDQTGNELAKKIKRYVNGKNTRFVISNETFCGDKLTGYQNAQKVAEILHDITKQLSLDVHVIVYLRRQDRFFESLYTQRVHNGVSYTFEEFLNFFDVSAFHWNDLLQAYADVFGEEKIIARRYGKAFFPEPFSLAQNFGNIIGSELLENYTKNHIHNPGFSHDALEIVRLTNLHLEKKESKKFRLLMKSISAKPLFKKYAFLDPQQRIELLQQYEDSNAEVAKKYFNETSGHLFPPPDEAENYEPYPGLATQAGVLNLAKAIAVVNGNVKDLERELREINQYRNRSVISKTRHKLGRLLSRLSWLKEKARSLQGVKK